MSLIKSLDRYIEKSQAIARAFVEEFDQTNITEIGLFNQALWQDIKTSTCHDYGLDIINDDETSLEFIIRLFIKIGFSCEDAARLMVQFHKNGHVELARAENHTLLRVQDYIHYQAKQQGFNLSCQINHYK